MKIDVFNHIIPKRFFERMITIRDKGSGLRRRVSEIPALTDLDHRFRMMDGFDGYAQVISLPSPPIEALAAPEKSPELANLPMMSWRNLSRNTETVFPASWPRYL